MITRRGLCGAGRAGRGAGPDPDRPRIETHSSEGSVPRLRSIGGRDAYVLAARSANGHALALDLAWRGRGWRAQPHAGDPYFGYSTMDGRLPPRVVTAKTRRGCSPAFRPAREPRAAPRSAHQGIRLLRSSLGRLSLGSTVVWSGWDAGCRVVGAPTGGPSGSSRSRTTSHRPSFVFKRRHSRGSSDAVGRR